MKLLMITGDRALAEGKRGAFYNTLEEFHKYWDRVDIICPRPITNYQLPITNLFGNVFIHPSPWPLIFQPFWILQEGLRILKNGQTINDKWQMVNGKWLMTVHEYPPFYNGIGARLLWSRIRVPYVLEIHHIPGYPKAAGFKEWLYKIATRFFIKCDAAKAKAVRVVNQHQVPEFLVKSGVPKEKIVYIPSFYIDLDIFKPVDHIRSLARARGASPEDLGEATSNGVEFEKKYDLIFIGRLVKNKGINLFLEAVKILNNPYSKFYIPHSKSIIVGDGPERKKVDKLITNYQLPITNYGWAKDSHEVAQLLNQSKVLIMPSYNEGGPRVVLEAMACGVPVLATPVGMVLDIIKDGESGGIIDWNPVDISQKALELLENTGKYQSYRTNGLEIASHFEKRVAIKNYAEKLLSTVFTRTFKI